MTSGKGNGGDATLDLGDGNLYGKPRRVEAAVEAAIASADLDDRDGGAAALAVEVARSVDVASGRKDPYGVAAAARELRECLQRLGLDPAARGGKNDADASWLDALGPSADVSDDPALRNSP